MINSLQYNMRIAIIIFTISTKKVCPPKNQKQKRYKMHIFVTDL